MFGGGLPFFWNISSFGDFWSVGIRHVPHPPISSLSLQLKEGILTRLKSDSRKQRLAAESIYALLPCEHAADARESTIIMMESFCCAGKRFASYVFFAPKSERKLYLVLTESDESRQVSAGTTSSCGRPSRTASIAYRWRPSSTKKSSVCTVGSVRS